MVFFSLKALYPTPTMAQSARAMAAAAFPDDVVQLLKQLMSIPSNTGEEGDAVDYLVAGLHADGCLHMFVHRQAVGERGRANVYATRAPIGERAPRLVFNSHIDTVPPHVDYREDEENVYGRGSCDAKGQVAAMILAARHLVRHRPALAADVGLLFVVGEETDHAGMIKANSLPGFAPEYLIVGEPTEMKFATIQKGACKVTLRVTGKAGHSGYPHSGESAIHKLLEILKDITDERWPRDEKHGDTTYNIGTIAGGQALNAWAAKAEASRIVAGRAEIDHSLGGNDPVLLSLPSFPHETGQASFNTDIPYYDKFKSLKGVYLFGAGSITVAHGPREFVPIAELRAAVGKHVQLAESILIREHDY
uniref:Peptidase n=1 Tax=Pristionchus pacificus TaxID=54126 RepID=A0A2A6CX81_PRIPA|eukprot:PDM82832.1 Peptidase [Pristionchus pacificus]